MPSYAVIGNPVEHSLSPRIHRLFSESTGCLLDYRAIQAPLSEFQSTLLDFKSRGGSGCNVTTPFKSQAFSLATMASPQAAIAKAANCLKFDGGHILAENFDGQGLLDDLTQRHQEDLSGKRILILGAGGAVRGVLFSLLSAGPTEIIIANRTLETAKILIKAMPVFSKTLLRACSIDALSSLSVDYIIHGTTLGHLEQCLALPSTLVTSDTFCYDLSYAAAAAPFLDWARRLGARCCVDGLGMLLEQAAASFYWWEGARPSEDIILKLRQDCAY